MSKDPAKRAVTTSGPALKIVGVTVTSSSARASLKKLSWTPTRAAAWVKLGK